MCYQTLSQTAPFESVRRFAILKSCRLAQANDDVVVERIGKAATQSSSQSISSRAGRRVRSFAALCCSYELGFDRIGSDRLESIKKQGNNKNNFGTHFVLLLSTYSG